MRNFLLGLVVITTLAACGQNGNGVTPSNNMVANNLDLSQLGELVRNSANAQDIEAKLNSDGSINNLDLNNDGSVDYVQVKEYGSGNNRGFYFIVDNGDGNPQQVADVKLTNGNGNVNMNIQGNPDIYGSNYYYSTNYLMRDMLLYHWLFSYHPIYASPYHYGYYPRTYVRHYPVGYRTRSYQTTRTVRTTRTTTRPSTSYNSYNRVNNRTKSLSSPTRSQRSFSYTSPSNSRPNTSGFRSSSRSSFSSSPSRSSFSSSRSSFGSSSRSSFGSSSRSRR